MAILKLETNSIKDEKADTHSPAMHPQVLTSLAHRHCPQTATDRLCNGGHNSTNAVYGRSAPELP